MPNNNHVIYLSKKAIIMFKINVLKHIDKKTCFMFSFVENEIENKRKSGTIFALLSRQ